VEDALVDKANTTLRSPKVFLLFMTLDSMPHQNIWRRWLDRAPPGQYKAYVHCKNSCPSIDQGIFNVIATVPTTYCLDLVTAMNSLVSAALQDPGYHAHDKFVFLSESHLPVKPFSVVYSQLTQNGNSDFCMFPRQEWHSHPPNARGITFLGVKHHQWMVLSRGHALRSSRLQGQVDGYSVRNALLQQNVTVVRGNSTARSPLLDAALAAFAGDQGATNMWASLGTKRWTNGCLDEFWHFNALYGTVANTGNVVTLSGVNGLPEMHLDSNENQGSCRTFVHWTKWGATGPSSDFAKVAAQLEATDEFAFSTMSVDRPGTVVSMSEKSLEVLRDSEFLFVRKVTSAMRYHDNCETVSMALDRVIFKAGSGITPTEPRFNFMGDGPWVDNFNAAVEIETLSTGRLKVTHSAVSAGNAEGSYDCSGRIWLKFANGVATSAEYNEMDKTLIFDNGVVWSKNPACFRGDGLWLDSMGTRVTVSSKPPHRVTVVNLASSDWKGVGSFSERTMDIKFANGVQLSCTVSPDGRRLHWSNGVQWYRV